MPGISPVILDGDAFPHQFFVISDNCSALSAGQALKLLKAETAQRSHRAQFLATPLSHMGLAGILQDRNIILFGERHNLIHIAGAPADVYRKQRFRVRINLLFNQIRIHHKGIRIGININRQRIVV